MKKLLKLETLEDLMKLDETTLKTVPGIGDKLSEKIMNAIK